MSQGHLRLDVGQLLWVGFEGTSIPSHLETWLSEGKVGGVTLFARNLPRAESGGELDVNALQSLNRALHQTNPSLPPLISVDQEGGRVQRIKAPYEHRPPMLHLSELPDGEAVRAAQKLGASMGRELRQLGFDINFAPVLDVHTNEDNPIIGDRAFGREPEAAATRALAYAAGLEQSGILACGKHFPGHGDTDTDSHLALPRLKHSLDRLRQRELLPFALATEAKIPMLMTAHVVFQALDDEVPATLSHRVVTELLRGEMGYEGVVVSDDLDMAAIAQNFGVGEAAVQAVDAGCDVLLLCRNRDHQDLALEALIRAAEKRSAFREKIAVAATRSRKLRSIQSAALSPS